MPSYTIPYSPSRLYSYSPTLGELMRLRAEQQANAIRQQGDISGQMWANVGNTIAGTLGHLAQYRMEAPRREYEALKLNEATSALERDRQIREVGRLTQGDPAAYAREVSLIDPDKGRALEAELRQQQQATLTQVAQRLNQHKTLFGRAAQMLDEVQRRPELYAQLRPQFVEMATAVHPSLVNEIPETYEPERVRGMLQFVTGAAEQADTRSRGLAALQAAQAETENTLKRDKLYRESLSSWLSTASSEDEWRMITDQARALQIPETTIAAFGEWSPEAPIRAARMGMTPAQRAAGAGDSDYARFLERWASDRQTTVDALTAAEELKAKDAFLRAGRLGGGESRVDTRLARQEERDRLRDLLQYHLENPDDTSVSMTEIEQGLTRVGLVPKVERSAAAHRIRRARIAEARALDLAGPEAGEVSSVEEILERADAAAQRALAARGQGGAPPPGDRRPPSAGTPGPPPRPRTASRAEVQAVADRLKIPYAEARKQLEARGVVVNDGGAARAPVSVPPAAVAPAPGRRVSRGAGASW